MVRGFETGVAETVRAARRHRLPASRPIQCAARFERVARAGVAAVGRRGVSPILCFIASMNARTFGEGSRVDGYTA